MAYKLYINNKLFNGIGNNNYNKGTIAINGTIYQFDNSTSAATQFNIYYHYLQPESQAVNTYTVNDGYVILAADIPTMANTDYLLDGYYYDSSFTNPVTVGDIINANTDIYLNWISKTYLFKIQGVYSNVNVDFATILNTKYLSEFYLLYTDSSSNVNLNNNTQSVSYNNGDERIDFTGYILSKSGNNSAQLKMSEEKYVVFTPNMSGKIKFYYRVSIDDTWSSNIPTALGGSICIAADTGSNIPASSYDINNTTPTTPPVYRDNVYESKYFTVSANQKYYVFLNAASTGRIIPRMVIFGFKFVAD